MMKHQGLIIFLGGQLRDSSPAFGSDGPLPMGVVFFLVSLYGSYVIP